MREFDAEQMPGDAAQAGEDEENGEPQGHAAFVVSPDEKKTAPSRRGSS